jgi:hypothetical protein
MEGMITIVFIVHDDSGNTAVSEPIEFEVRGERNGICLPAILFSSVFILLISGVIIWRMGIIEGAIDHWKKKR